ncbi:MAG: ShlB/FhaC/HecB family hemolysin secretion/activation protein [Betaproteobacteria bacterium]|nr:ShlB/FhaC/HecB family hemolysin secretion/activation protein [Betaproteobacteria bacterium]
MPANRHFGLFTLAAWMSLATPFGVVWAQAPPTEIPAAPRFDITRFDVNGNTLLKSEDIERAVAPYIGKQKDFADIQRALESLEQAYRDRGYGVVQVLLPEQDITRGVVQLRVNEPRIGKITVEGNKHFNETNIRASLPALKLGATPNSQQVARNLQLLAEHPTKQTTVLLRSGATENEVDAAVKVADEKPLKFVVTFDNSGTNATGRFRTGFGVQHSNMFNRDHILNLQYVTNPEHPSKVAIFGGGYRIPFYADNSTLDVFAGYSDVDSGTLQDLFNVSGSGTILGARYNLHLTKIGEYEHKLSFGLDYRAFKNNVTLLGVALVPDITVHPASITYNGLWRMTNAELGFSATVSQNLFPGGNDGADSDFKGPIPGFLNVVRTDATAGYRIWRAGVNYTRVFAKEWQLRAVFNGQYSDDALVPGEQFGFGGPDSVRGFQNREVSNDKGYAASLEVYTPELGSKFGWKDVKTRLLAFYDMGTTGRNSIQPGELSGQSGGSVGFGLRLAYGKSVSVRMDFAQVIDPAGNQARNDQMLQASMALIF